MPAATAVVVNDQGAILLQRRADNDLWALPGGTMDVGETLRQTIIREVQEETGLDIEPLGLVGIYSDPAHVIAYSDGEVRQEFFICFRTRVIRGALRHDAESTNLRWFAPDDITDLPMHPTMRLRIKHYLAEDQQPFLQ